MKDEYKGILINKLVGLTSKMHCILSESNKKSNKTKQMNISLDFGEYTILVNMQSQHNVIIMFR